MVSAAGPSNIDARGWRSVYTSYHSASADLCNALASIAPCLCTEYVDPTGLTAFTASRLIALDKCPGVRPIGVGEVVQRVIGKTVLSVIGVEIQHHTQYLQSDEKCLLEIGCSAHLDVRAQSFWGIHHQQANFDVRVFNPCYKSPDSPLCLLQIS